jgi:hypothetical protein
VIGGATAPDPHIGLAARGSIRFV